MRSTILAGAASLLLAAGAMADQYPPGPDNCCPDTLTIINVQNPAASPHLGSGDIVLGVGGVVTGFFGQSRPYGFYMQMRNGLPYSGIPLFTGNVDHGPGSAQDLQLGDSVVVYAKVKSYKNTTALGALGGSDEITALSLEGPGADDVTVRLVTRGNALPPFHAGSVAELNQDIDNPDGVPWRAMLVRINGPLKVVGTYESDPLAPGGNPGYDRGFLLTDAACTGPECDTVRVECAALTNLAPPPVGTILSSIRGIFDRREAYNIIQVRGADDLGAGIPALALDAFPIDDNDLPGAQRLDIVMVVFDQPVEETSAGNVANYSLASNGAIEAAQRMNAPEDNRVVLRVRNGLDDGAAEAVTVSNVKSLADGTPMAAPQTLQFLNGVIELEKVRVPDAGALAGNPCEDRSRYSGAGSDPGPRASFQGTVTGAWGDYYALQGTTLTRGGLWVQAPGLALTPGRGVVLSGALQEVLGHTQGAGIVYVRDLGAAPAPVPAVQSVGVLIDETCDASQLFLTGQDLDGMLVTLDRVVVTQVLPNGSFYVATPGSGAALAAARARQAGTSSMSQVTAAGQILVVALGGNFTTPPEAGRIVTVTGALGRESDDFAIFPRSTGDIHDFGPVPTFSLPLNVSKSATMSRDPDIVKGVNGELFMSWGRVFHESVHSLSLDLTQNWSFPIPIMHQGVQPALAVTPSNKFGVVTATPNALIFKQSTDGGIQMDPLVTTVDANPTQYPALTVGSGEHFHAAWERQNFGIFYAGSLTGGADFSAPVQISTTEPSETNTMARIGASTADNVYVFWQNHRSGDPAVDRVLYSRSLDGGATFSTPRQVRDERNPLTSVVKLAILGDAQVGPDGTVYVMGLQAGGPNDSVAFLRSTNNGQTFALVGHVTAPALTGICPKSFAVGPNGEIHALVGVCGTALYYTRSTDGGATWGPAVDVTSARSPTVGEPRGAKIILDGTGTPVIVWFSQAGGSTEIFSSRLLN